VDTVMKALRVSAPELLRLPNVVGVGKGEKFVGGHTTGKASLTVLVSKKVPRNRLSAYQAVPKNVYEAETDVIEVGEIKALFALSRTDRMRHARPGSSIGHYKITAGTFGALVYDAKTGEPLILSNNHVLANSSNGKDGRAKIGDPILQPGKHDNGVDDDVIARLHRFVPINPEETTSECSVAASVERFLNRVIRRFRTDYYLRMLRKTGATNLVDAAVAKPVSEDLVVDDIIDIGVPYGTAEVVVGEEVRKSGRTSGTNSAVVKVVHSTIKVNMGDTGDAVFSDQVVTSQMAQPGDSGSLVVNSKNQAVGLLSAGSDTVSIFARIKNVCDLLGIRINR
jgi:hypothetical protein